MRIKLILLPLLLLTPVLPACTPYKMEIRQGNYVSFDMRQQLKTGMTRQQVRYLLGTPMISDPFHDDRWDYAYRLEQGGKLVEQQNMTLYFEGDSLARIVDGEKAVPAASAKTNETTKQRNVYEQD